MAAPNKKPKSTALVPVIETGPRLPTKREMDARRLYQDWLAHLAPRTRRAYAGDLEYFAAFLGCKDGVKAADHLRAQTLGEANALVLEYRTSMVSKGLAPSTVNRRLAAVRSIVKLGNTLGYMPWSLSIPGVKQERRRDMSGPSTEAVYTMLKMTAGEDWKSRRDHAMLRLMYGIGLRRSEVVLLDVADVDFVNCVIMVKGKGRSEKAPLQFVDHTRIALERWLQVRGKPKTPALFLHEPMGERAPDTDVYDFVKDLGKQLGLVDEQGRSKVRPHGFRHSSITKVIEKGGIEAGQLFARHKNPQTTMGYFDGSKGVVKKAVKMLEEEEDKKPKE